MTTGPALGVTGGDAGPDDNREALNMARRMSKRTRTVDEAIASLDETSLQCRDFGHSWRPYSAIYIPARRQYDERLRCGRCDTIRVRLLDSRGAQLASRYDYADGYLVKGLGRLTGEDRDAVRLAGVQLLLDTFAEPVAKGA